MAFRTRGRRRRPNVQWLPVLGINLGEDERQANGIFTEIELDGSGATRWDAAGITFDYTDSAEAEQGAYSKSLQDLVAGNNYRLRRIVGKIWAAWSPNTGEGGTPPCIDYGCGFIVTKTDDLGNPTTDFDDVNPLAQDSAEDPWIWRRRWVLSTLPDIAYMGSQGIVGQDQYAALQYPKSTAQYNSVADGPHIDQKTARVIDRQERLFMVQAARVFSPAGQSVTYNRPGFLHSFLDYRLLGSLIKSSPGNRRNASR